MTIHHDKKAYGIIKQVRETLDEEKISAMLEELNKQLEEENEDDDETDA